MVHAHKLAGHQSSVEAIRRILWSKMTYDANEFIASLENLKGAARQLRPSSLGTLDAT